jgi:tRNA 5-methylaminomethyl-2-thiouridine biosynthesis bifunctional protein
VEGATVAAADAVCLAGGAGLARWRPELEFVAGQASWTGAATLPGAPASWGGYAIPTRDGGLLFGATHERGQNPAEATPEGERRNLATLGERMPETAAGISPDSLESRASVRATTPDRAPLAGMIEPGLFVLGGLGGRGFTWAPLLAEHVAARLTGAPSPLPLELSEVVAPDRYERRAARKRAS